MLISTTIQTHSKADKNYKFLYCLLTTDIFQPNNEYGLEILLCLKQVI